MDTNHLKKNSLVRVALMAVVLVQGAQMTMVNAEIFKCTNKAGKVFYNDKPCPVESDEKKIQNEKDPVNGYAPQQTKHSEAVVKENNSANKSLQKPSFYKLEQQGSSDEISTQNTDNQAASGHRGVIANPATRERIPVKHFQDENNKVKSTKTESHPAPVNKRRADGKLSLEEKKAFLGINSEPE